MAGVLEQMTLEPLPVIGAEAARAQVDHEPVAPSAARAASSVSMALICARIGTRAGESGRTRARLAVSSRVARSSSPDVSRRTS